MIRGLLRELSIYSLNKFIAQLNFSCCSHGQQGGKADDPLKLICQNHQMLFLSCIISSHDPALVLTKALSRYLKQSMFATTESFVLYMTIQRANLKVFHINYNIPTHKYIPVTSVE